MEKNNPIRLADDERRFIWPKPSEHNRDIVVSIGTGCSTNRDGMRQEDPTLSNFLQNLQRLSIVRKIVILKSVLQSVLNCQKMWDAFINSLGVDEHLLGKCHRVNVPYGVGQSLCNLDDWQKMRDTKEEALKVLSGKSNSVSSFVQDQLRDQLDLIARQLLASLFYLSVRTLDTDHNDKYSYICHAWIRCRLGHSYGKQFHSLCRQNPAFRVVDSFDNEHNLSFDPRAWDATFSALAQFQFHRESHAVRIELTLDNGRHWDTIGGFPRHLRAPAS